MIIDYHMHLELDDYYEKCRYNTERIARYVEVARAQGTHEIGISEHCNRFSAFRPVMEHLLRPTHGYEGAEHITGWLIRSFREDIHAYVDALAAARREGLPVKASIEVDYLPGREQAIKEILDPLPFDYLLGAIHFLDDWLLDFSSEYGWPQVDVDAVFNQYYETFCAAARSNLFHIMAHPDLVKKYGHRPSFPLDEFYDACAKAAAEADVAIEINTAGLHKPVAEMYPAKGLLERFFDRGVPLSLGSDAHRPEDVSRDHEAAIELAAGVGYREIVRFDQGTRTLVPLG